MKKSWTAAGLSTASAALVLAAAALAQVPAAGASSVAQATGTASPAASGTAVASTTAVSTGTAVASGTAQASGTAVSTGTAVATGTGVVTGTTTPVPTIPVPTAVYVAGGQGNFGFANPAFTNVWNRTDKPVAEKKVNRTWFWGPGPNTPGLLEQYNESPTGDKQRLVQYFDKSRMEINNPSAASSQPFFVTNGLLTVELISGFVQVGEKDFVQYRPACIPMSGDFGDTNAPTYFAFQGVSNTQAGNHPAQNRTGQRATETIDRNGKVGNDPAKASVSGTDFVHFEATTNHNIPSAFWTFLNSSGPVYNAQNQIVNEQLITPWFYASGLPISEPYWTKAKINGVLTDVMVQAFERRSLTYVPTNPAGFQVEMGNIGQHYFDWRYRNYGYCAGQPVTTPTPPKPAPSGTVTPGTTGTASPVTTGTAVTTGTPAATGTTTPGTTGTASPAATGTAVPSVTTTP